MFSTDFQFGFGKVRYVGFIAFLLIQGTCAPGEYGDQNALEFNLKVSGRNRPELEKVLTRYSQDPADSLKLKAAVFLISNMEDNRYFGGEWLKRFDPLFDRIASLGNEGILNLKDSIENEIGPARSGDMEIKEDLQHLKADYLIRNIDEAFVSWQKAPWKSQVSFDSFCNYILPYKSFTEFPEDWRSMLLNKYRYILDNPDIPDNMEDISCALVSEEKTWFRYSEALTNYPSPLSIGQIMRGKKGNCVEMSNLAAYSARALGIPVAIDFTPQWGNFSGAHVWNALILPDGGFWPFIGAEGFPGDWTSISQGESKIAKAYRRRVAIDSASFAIIARQAGIRDIPEALKNPRIQDVTSAYTETADIRLSIKASTGTPVYLCLLDQGGWGAISGGIAENESVLFRNMGKEVVYMPAYYKGGNYKPVGPPFLIRGHSSLKELKPDLSQKQSLKLFRKYPLKRARIENHMEYPLFYARFEGSQGPEFNNSVLLHEIIPYPPRHNPRYLMDLAQKDRSRYDARWKETLVSTPDSFRYVRMIFAKDKPFRLGEMEFYGPANDRPLQGHSIGNIPDPQWAFDGFPGRSLRPDSLKIDSAWVGLDLGKNSSVNRIRYLPADDLNSIEPGKTYELFYWDGSWVSAGRQQAYRTVLEYHNIPAGALFWLRCMDCAINDERPFTYEEGVQVWW